MSEITTSAELTLRVTFRCNPAEPGTFTDGLQNEPDVPAWREIDEIFVSHGGAETKLTGAEIHPDTMKDLQEAVDYWEGCNNQSQR